MSAEDGTISRKTPDPESRPPFSIRRILCHRARVSDLSAGASTNVAVHDLIRRSHTAIGGLIHTRRVGPFVVRLVCGSDWDVWWVVEVDSRAQRVVLLAYGSEGDRAREAAAQYAANATEIDLASDFDPDAHFFGERRLPRASSPARDA